ncbi:hypothetical protein BDZ45DRAFT_416094 [Acephala macrosclerotiorum]|nr:hypothetical protein BDZ45DRAFT_416094 [Acephala macrosclerotiorum]
MSLGNSPSGNFPPANLNHSTRRTPRACDNCRRRKTKCLGESPQCSQCKQLGQPCSYSTPRVTWNHDDRFFLVGEVKKAIDAGVAFEAGYKSSAWNKIASALRAPLNNAESCRLQWLQLKEQCRAFNHVLELPGFTWDHKASKIFADEFLWYILSKDRYRHELVRWRSIAFPQFFNVFHVVMYAAAGGSTVEQAFCALRLVQKNDTESKAGAKKRDREPTEDLEATNTPNNAGNGSSGYDAVQDSSPFGDSAFGEIEFGDVGPGGGGLGNSSFGNSGPLILDNIGLGSSGLGDSGLGNNGLRNNDFGDNGFGHEGFGVGGYRGVPSQSHLEGA